MDSAPALSMRDVVFRYLEQGKRNILDHVDLDIPAGRVTVLMGAGGCGKSTLAAVAAGLYPENGGFLAGGQIRWFGTDLAAMDPQQRARQVGMLFQNPDLQFCMDTLRGEMRFCMENLCLDAAAMDPRSVSMQNCCAGCTGRGAPSSRSTTSPRCGWIPPTSSSCSGRAAGRRPGASSSRRTGPPRCSA